MSEKTKWDAGNLRFMLVIAIGWMILGFTVGKNCCAEEISDAMTNHGGEQVFQLTPTGLLLVEDDTEETSMTVVMSEEDPLFLEVTFNEKQIFVVDGIEWDADYVVLPIKHAHDVTVEMTTEDGGKWKAVWVNADAAIEGEVTMTSERVIDRFSHTEDSYDFIDEAEFDTGLAGPGDDLVIPAEGIRVQSEANEDNLLHIVTDSKEAGLEIEEPDDYYEPEIDQDLVFSEEVEEEPETVTADYFIIEVKYLVTWDVVDTFMVPCPQPEPFVDAYGVTHGSMTMTLQSCWDSTRSSKSKEFDTLEDAVAFIDAAPKDETFGWGSHCENFVTSEVLR